MGASRPCRRRSCRVAALCARMPSPRAQRPRLRAPAQRLPALRAYYVPSALACAVSWACVRAGTAVSWPALRHSPSLLTIQVGQLYCNTLQPPAGQYCNTLLSRYTLWSCNTVPPQAAIQSDHLPFAIHSSVLQYNSSPSSPFKFQYGKCIAIHFTNCPPKAIMLQYNCYPLGYVTIQFSSLLHT